MPAKPKNKIRTSWATQLYLDHPPLRGKFIHDFRQLLKQKYQKYIDAYGKEKYKCGHNHDPRDPTWKPFQHFEKFCAKMGLEDLATREYLEEMWSHKIVCECEFLIDPIEERKEALRRQFGVDFEIGDVELVD
jgi:hypothetical protein